MVFLYAVEYVLVILFLLVLVFQVVIPMIFGEPLFPYFRWKKIRRAQADIKDAIAQEIVSERIRQAEAEYYARLAKHAKTDKGEEQNDVQNNP